VNRDLGKRLRQLVLVLSALVVAWMAVALITGATSSQGFGCGGYGYGYGYTNPCPTPSPTPTGTPTATPTGTPSSTPTPPPPGAKVPTVTNGGASRVTPNSATLHGTVDPNGSSTQYAFQYGLSKNYGAVTSPRGNAGSGKLPVPAKADLSGLEAGRRYHYRLIAANSAGVSESGDRTFDTPLTGRLRPRRVTLHAKPRHDSGLPFKFRFFGAVQLPRKVGKTACRGSVTLKVRHGHRTVATKHLKVHHSDCSFSRRVTFKTHKHLGTHGKLKATARFQGNSLLGPRSSGTARVHYG
jgi:hypothetical protein